MIKIVIDEQTRQEDIAKAIETYKQEHNIDETIMVLSPKEWEKERINIKTDNDIILISKEDYNHDLELAKTQELLYKGVEIEDIKFQVPISKTEICQGRTEKQKREEDKWRKRYFRK